MLIALLVLLAMAAALYFFLVKRPARLAHSGNAAGAAADATGRFHAVSIRPGPTCCQRARDLRGKRFLSAEAPMLPLPRCGEPACTCRFIHHADRRDGDDRRLPFQRGFGGSSGRMAEDRREIPDRRRANGHDPLYSG